MTNYTCNDCKFVGKNSTSDAIDKGFFLECRRFPPQVYYNRAVKELDAVYPPLVDETEPCGEFVIDDDLSKEQASAHV